MRKHPVVRTLKNLFLIAFLWIKCEIRYAVFLLAIFVSWRNRSLLADVN